VEIVLIVVTEPLVTLDQEGASMAELVCNVIVAADFDVPDIKVDSK